MNHGEPYATEVELEDVLHLSLQLGRLLLANGADTAEVQTAVTRFATAFGCEAHLLVTYEALVVTVLAGGSFRTKAGHHLPAMNVNMRAIAALNHVVDEAVLGRLAPAAARSRLDAIERGLPSYGRWVVVGGSAVSAASLSTLLGGDWLVFLIAFVAGACATWARQELSRRRFNPFAVPFITALVGGVIGGLAATACAVELPTLCMITPALIIVPGVPLINAIKDSISNHIPLALARLGFAGLVLLAIAFGLFAAAVVTGVRNPSETDVQLPPILLGALLSVLAVTGFAVMFNVPFHLFWACVLCGVCSYTLRTALMHFGIGIVTGTLLAAFAVGLLSRILARRFRAPAAAFAFPGVVAMVPGTNAFQMVIGALRILKAGAAASPALVAGTVSLAIVTFLLAAAITIGLAVPLALGRTGAVPDKPPRQPAAS